MGDVAQLKFNLLHQRPVLFDGDLLSGRGYVNQPPDQAAFGIRNLDGLVGAHEEEGVEFSRVGSLEFFINRHPLMGNQAV